jgi:hypothetical protein
LRAPCSRSPPLASSFAGFPPISGDALAILVIGAVVGGLAAAAASSGQLMLPVPSRSLAQTPTATDIDRRRAARVGSLCRPGRCVTALVSPTTSQAPAKPTPVPTSTDLADRARAEQACLPQHSDRASVPPPSPLLNPVARPFTLPCPSPHADLAPASAPAVPAPPTPAATPPLVVFQFGAGPPVTFTFTVPHPAPPPPPSAAAAVPAKSSMTWDEGAARALTLVPRPHLCVHEPCISVRTISTCWFGGCVHGCVCTHGRYGPQDEWCAACTTRLSPAPVFPPYVPAVPASARPSAWRRRWKPPPVDPKSDPLARRVRLAPSSIPGGQASHPRVPLPVPAALPPRSSNATPLPPALPPAAQTGPALPPPPSPLPLQRPAGGGGGGGSGGGGGAWYVVGRRRRARTSRPHRICHLPPGATAVVMPPGAREAAGGGEDVFAAMRHALRVLMRQSFTALVSPRHHSAFLGLLRDPSQDPATRQIH